jgi:O-antigen/teichoic acid export membrane protein
MINKLFPVVLSRGLNAVIQIVLLLIYAEFLQKSEYGELSLLMIFVGLSYTIIDFGIANTLITNNLSKKNQSRVRTLTLILAILLSVVVVFTSTKIRVYFNASAEFSHSLEIMAGFFILHSISIVPYARLHKAQRIIELSFVDFGSVLIMFISAILSLSIGLGLYAFPTALLIQSISKIAILSFFNKTWFSYRMDVHKIDFYPKLLTQFLSNIVVYLSFRIDQLVVGRILDVERLGEYSFLKQIIIQPTSLLIAIYSQLLFPYFSRIKTQLLKVKSGFLFSNAILIGTVCLYYSILQIEYTPPFENIRNLWNFSSTLSYMLMVFAISKILLDTLSVVSTAIGKVVNQIKRNLILVIFAYFSSFIIAVFSFEMYVFSLSFVTFLLSISLYFSNFKKVKTR